MEYYSAKERNEVLTPATGWMNPENIIPVKEVGHTRPFIVVVLFSCQVVSDSLWPHGLQHTRLTCPSPFPGVCPSSCPLNWWCHQTISSSVAPSPALNPSQHRGLFQWAGSSHQVTKVLELQLQHQSFQRVFRFISFRIDWFDLLAVQGPLRSLLQHRSHIRPFITGLYVYGTSRKGKSVETGRLVLGGGWGWGWQWVGGSGGDQ